MLSYSNPDKQYPSLFSLNSLFQNQQSFSSHSTAMLPTTYIHCQHNYRQGETTAAAKLLQSCPTLCDPIDGGPPGSAPLGFSRQEHWSWLPFPSPVHESEKWKWSHSVMSDFSWPHGLQTTRLLHPWDLPGKSTGVGCHCLLQLNTLWSLNAQFFYY